MTSLLIGTASLLSSSASIVAGLKHLSSRIKVLVSPGLGYELRDIDRRRLLAVHRRVECLMGPLNLCVQLSSERDSCVAETVSYCRELIDSVSVWMESVRFTASETSPNVKCLDEASVEKLDYYLRELEFACSSIQLAREILLGSSGQNSPPYSVSPPASPSSVGPPNIISPSALLKSSRRLWDMKGKSGDLVVVEGRVFRKNLEISSPAILRLAQTAENSFLLSVSADPAPLSVSIEAEFSCCTLQRMGIGSEDAVDAAALVWWCSEDISRSVSNGTSRHADEEDGVVLVTVEEPQRMNRTRKQIKERSLVSPDFAFTPGKVSSWSVTDLLYLLRLCTLEISGRSHSTASDEELTVLLCRRNEHH